MAKPRDTQTYALYDGNTKVYIGTTNDLARREQEHQSDGKRFTRIEATSRRMTEGGAEQREVEQLEAYRRGHHGNNPQYNEDSAG